MTATIDQATPTRTIDFTCTLGELTDALNAVALAVPRRGQPLLTGVHIESGHPDVLVVSAFDYDTSIRVRVDARTAGFGAVLLPHADLLKLCRGAAKGDTARVWRSHQVQTVVKRTSGIRNDTLPSGATKAVPWTHDEASVRVAGFSLPITGMDISDYPVLPEPGGDTAASFTIDRDVLVKELARLCATADDGKQMVPALELVNINLRDGIAVLATTNRWQLGVVDLAVDTQVAGRTAWNLPAAQLHKVAKLLPAGPVTIQFPETPTRWATVTGGGITATMQLPDDEFPRYQSLLPNSTAVASVNRAELLRAVVKAEALTPDRIRLMTVQVLDDAVVITPGVDNEGGRKAVGRSIGADVTGLDGPLTVGFNPKFLRSAVEQADGDRVRIGLTTPTRPVMFTTDSDNHRTLVMPCRMPDPSAPTFGKVPAPRVVNGPAL